MYLIDRILLAITALLNYRTQYDEDQDAFCAKFIVSNSRYENKKYRILAVALSSSRVNSGFTQIS